MKKAFKTTAIATLVGLALVTSGAANSQMSGMSGMAGSSGYFKITPDGQKIGRA